ncbi:hypothetical protein [Bartonella sp. DGB2]|uniref:hypothetical protein n=1 Tax=Bartonella sp. DGB2 TaxID=3388426 RepID=UPI00398F97CC
MVRHGKYTPEDRRNAAAHTGYVRVTQFWYDSYDEAYWDAQVEKFTLNGTIAAQTWLNAQDGWLTHIDLFFSQIAKTGDIHVLITETDHGAPDLNKVLARVKIAVEDLKVYPHETKVPIGPVFVTKGRYALVLVTDGAHMACTINGNKYGQGQYFYSGDGGGWFMGDAKIDLAMRAFIMPISTQHAQKCKWSHGCWKAALVMLIFWPKALCPKAVNWCGKSVLKANGDPLLAMHQTSCSVLTRFMKRAWCSLEQLTLCQALPLALRQASQQRAHAQIIPISQRHAQCLQASPL